MPACPLLTLRRPPREGPTHNSESWLIAIHYHVVDFHHLLYAGFYRRFLGVPLLSLMSIFHLFNASVVSLSFVLFFSH